MNINTDAPDNQKDTNYKKCTMCDFIWERQEDFLRDPTLNVIGYQADFKDLQAGFFLFDHKCRTTLAIPAKAFHNLYDGPIFAERHTGEEDCPSYCLLPKELRPCPAQCECAYVREILQIVKDWPKKMRA